LKTQNIAEFGARHLVSRPDHISLTTPFRSRAIFQTNLPGRLDERTEIEHRSLYVLIKEATMLKIFVEEAAALASIALFVGMIAVWAQIIPQL
jgi:hypothetical protein